MKGGRILGEYPDNLGPEGPLNVGRGRLIPTLSWESMWNAWVEWFGVEQNQKDFRRQTASFTYRVKRFRIRICSKLCVCVCVCVCVIVCVSTLY